MEMLVVPVVVAIAGALGGQVEVSSLGPVRVIADGVSLDAFHVRAVLANRDDATPWAFNAITAEADVGGADARPVRAALANGNVATLPIVIVDPGQRAMIDLYFPVADATNREPVSVTLHIATADRRYVRRLQVAPAPDAASPRAGWGKTWWARADYGWPAFHRSSGALTPRAPFAIEVAGGRDDVPPSTACGEW
jgi:hypothetical protein